VKIGDINGSIHSVFGEHTIVYDSTGIMRLMTAVNAPYFFVYAHGNIRSYTIPYMLVNDHIRSPQLLTWAVHCHAYLVVFLPLWAKVQVMNCQK
jgi:hypothetical protein